MISPTSRAILLVALGAPLGLLLGLTAPPLWPIAVAWAATIALLIVVDGLLASGQGRFAIAVDAPPLAPMGAGSTSALVHLNFLPGRGPPRARLSLETNALLTPSPEMQRALPSETGAEARFDLALKRRGEGRIENAYTRWPGPLGLAWRQRVTALDTKIPITPDLGAIEREAERLFSRTMIHGIKPLRDRGDGSEFDALADFQGGMDTRLIEWKQSGRHQKLLAKEVRAERNHQIAFAIDTGRVMSDPIAGAPRVDWSLNAALMLAYVGLKLGDRVSFFGFDARPNLSTGFVTGTRSFTHLQALTARLDYSTEETNYTLGLATLAEKLQRRSMVVVFTDFADTISAELMLENITRLARRHMVVFVTFPDEDLELLREKAPADSDDVTRAVIAQRLLRERSVVLTRLKRLGVRVVSAPMAGLGPALVRAYDELRRQERV